MPQKTINLLNEAAKVNKADKFRHGNIIRLPEKGKLIVAGDIHGHRRNFERIISFADLQNNPDTHLIIQEIIHGGDEDIYGGCMSYKLLFEAVDYKLKFPHRLHILMGNHDTAFINDRPVMKDGREMNLCMHTALKRQFPDRFKEIESALREYLLSQPLACRCENRMWLSHSLPSDRNIEKFNADVLEKELTADDTASKGSAYFLTWGRNISQGSLDKMAKLFDADIFILGHQTQPNGWVTIGNNLIIITSEHNHGCLLHIELEKSYNIQQLTDSIVPLASIF
jgi:predicted phosphodiesterase